MDEQPTQNYFANDAGEQLRFALVICLIISALWIVGVFFGYRAMNARVEAANSAASQALAAQWAADARAVVAQTRQDMAVAEADTLKAQLAAYEQAAGTDVDAAHALAIQEYHRGLFDMCTLFATSPTFGFPANVAVESCLQAVAGSYESNWYAEPSSGWQWPLPEGGE